MILSETKATKLDNFFRDDFERGKTDKFIVNMKDIGDPLLCKLGNLIKSGSSGYTFGLKMIVATSNRIYSKTIHFVWMLQV